VRARRVRAFASRCRIANEQRRCSEQLLELFYGEPGISDNVTEVERLAEDVEVAKRVRVEGPQSYNADSYVRNNPVTFKDPTGAQLEGQDSNRTSEFRPSQFRGSFSS
jgi:hypothetical protein